MSSFTASSHEPEHRVAIAFGSNIGDRAGNVIAAIQRLRTCVRIERISQAYETKPVGFTEQPDFLNLVCTGFTKLAPHALRDAMARIERQVGRRSSVPLGPRAIDLDLLLYDDLISDDKTCTLPHPGLGSRAFVLVPLAEIAPELVHPRSGKTIAELARAVDRSGVVAREGGLLTRIVRDVQESRPVVPLALNRVGVVGVKTLIELRTESAPPQQTIATVDLYADLDAEHSGVHMSRFSQDLEDGLAELRWDGANLAEPAHSVAVRVVESQHADRAEIVLRAPLALDRITPASALPTREFYTAIARAVVTPRFSRRMTGVEVEGMTACPCAQAMVAEHARERLLGEGFSEDQIAKILTAIPIATHNQRGVGTLLVGSDRPVSLEQLVEIVEQSMSSETYDLLKRPDELFVVNKAHQSPRFVEDVVREIFRYCADVLEEFPPDTFIFARQVNHESIHKHDAVAESGCTLAELLRELRGEREVQHTTLERWLAGDLVTQQR
jgi:GTP cyclohydrolase-4